MGMTNYKEKLQNIKSFVFDIDGILTGGDILITEEGRMLRTMSAKDSYAIRRAVEECFIVGIVSAVTDISVMHRLKQMNISDENVYLATQNKKKAFINFAEKNALSIDEIIYMGDDIPDIEPLQLAGLGTCAQDACEEVKAIAEYVSHKKGGRGCVRDIIRQTLKIQGKWDI
ncbi:3-deoxy-D-manno-octulosonate 8-phosphate phosphatase [Elysia marginata]|uniref:3-deoxy-D-manno-octulosonate 8-phosphate phosphatase n=1 Tax=Elysia marginata TaxID=1093978 RepID=A0AAV4GRR5_9GAST|nr:3-deoxy-D-manno-octulosonate 8-phosphate phosphatase [Elysia marginata]